MNPAQAFLPGDLGRPPGQVGGGALGGNVTGGSVTGGNVTGGSVTGGNVTGGNVTGGNVTGGVTGVSGSSVTGGGGPPAGVPELDPGVFWGAILLLIGGSLILTDRPTPAT
jgi:hypothetical protein